MIMDLAYVDKLVKIFDVKKLLDRQNLPDKHGDAKKMKTKVSKKGPLVSKCKKKETGTNIFGLTTIQTFI